MSWSYDNTNLDKTTASGRRNAVRMLIRDTDQSDQLIEDEEIDFHLSETSNDVYLAAAASCDSLAAFFARLADSQIDDGALQIKYSKSVDGYRSMGRQYRNTAKRTGGALGLPRGGGISKSTSDSVRADTDRVEPAFRMRQFASNDPIDDGEEIR